MKVEILKFQHLFFFIMKYITPIILLCIMIWWAIQDAIPTLLLTNVDSEKVPYIWGARILMLIISVGILLMIKRAWMKKSIVKNRSL